MRKLRLSLSCIRSMRLSFAESEELSVGLSSGKMIIDIQGLEKSDQISFKSSLNPSETLLY